MVAGQARSRGRNCRPSASHRPKTDLGSDDHVDFKQARTSPSAFRRHVPVAAHRGLGPWSGTERCRSDRVVREASATSTRRRQRPERSRQPVIGRGHRDPTVPGQRPRRCPGYVHLDRERPRYDGDARTSIRPTGRPTEPVRPARSGYADECEIVGIEIKRMERPEMAPMVGDPVAPMLDGAGRGLDASAELRAEWGVGTYHSCNRRGADGKERDKEEVD